MFTELPAGHMMPSTGHPGDDDELRDESSLPSEDDLYAAMLALFLGFSCFHVSDEGEHG